MLTPPLNLHLPNLGISADALRLQPAYIRCRGVLLFFNLVAVRSANQRSFAERTATNSDGSRSEPPRKKLDYFEYLVRPVDGDGFSFRLFPKSFEV